MRVFSEPRIYIGEDDGMIFLSESKFHPFVSPKQGAYIHSCAIQSLIAEYEMKLENAERYDHGDELIIEDMIKNLKELVG